MTAAQLRKYRAEWGAARKAMRAMGISPKDCDARRMKIHLEAKAVDRQTGEPKSSLALTNAEFTRVLGIFWYWSASSDLAKQAHVVLQPGIQCRWVCEHIMELTNEICPDTYNMAHARKYIDAIFRRQNPQFKKMDPDWADFAEWRSVQSAMVYRYDQVIRASLGNAGKTTEEHRGRRAVQYHPSQHDKHMQTLGCTQPQPAAEQYHQTPEPAYAGPTNEGDPF